VLDRTVGATFPSKLNVGVFFEMLWTPVSWKRLYISKCAQVVNYCKLKTYELDSVCVFDIPNGFWNVSKSWFWKKFVRGYGFQKRLDLDQNTFKNVCFTWELSLPWTAQSRQYFPKIRGGGVCWDISNRCILTNGWRYLNGHGSIRSPSDPFFSFFF